MRREQCKNIVACVLVLILDYPSVAVADHDRGLSVSIGGRIKLDGIYNSDSVSGRKKSKSDLAFSPGSIPLTDRGGDLDLNFRESRIWSTLHMPAFNHELSGYVEFDFFDTRRNANGVVHVANKPRLRHLYANYRDLTVGKTYTTFVNMSAYPEINDANGPVGVLSIRQPLIRYQHDFDFGEISIAAEHTESTFTTTTGSRFQVNDDHLPDFVTKLDVSEDWGNISFAAMARQIHSNGAVPNGDNEKKWGAAVSTAGRLFIQGQDNLRYTLSYGNVLGRYVSYGAFDDAVMGNNGDVALTEIIAGHVSYQHWWQPRLRSSLVLGAAYADIDTGRTLSTVNRYFASAMVNLIWSPSINSTVGIEWLHGHRERVDGQDGTIDRMQVSFIYKFE